MARSDPTAWVVEVLEGPAAGATVELNGRELPYRSAQGGTISFGKTQRTKQTWYQGNPVASQQIIGPILKPTAINGVWKERYIGTDRPIDLVELFEELLDTGVQVRISWSTIERVGIVKDFTWYPGDPIGGLGDIRWEMIFEWNQAVPAIPRRVGDGQPAVRDLLADAANKLVILGDGIEAFSSGVGTFVGQAKQSYESIDRAFSTFTEALESPLDIQSSTAARMGDEPNLPARLLEDASSAAGSAQETSGRIALFTGSIFPGNTVVSDNFEDILEESLSRYEIIDNCYDSMESQFDTRVRLEEIVRPDEFTTIPAFVGGDLREVAIQFYGDADLWDRIAKQNGLDTSLIPDDVEELVIPLSLPDATDRKIGC